MTDREREIRERADAVEWHEAHVGRGELDAEDCAVCAVTNALDRVDTALASGTGWRRD